jgi:precorrin-2/cobalt-factor-2 C20-methyltransferase
MQIISFLEQGKNVGFITLGDPGTYSTYMYVHEIIAAEGFECEIIPGVTSYSAAAAAFGTALCEGDETLLIIPARHSKSVDELLGLPGNKVIMKSGKNLAHVLDALKKRGYADKTKLACRVTMEGQRLFGSIGEYESAQESGYFTIALVKE